MILEVVKFLKKITFTDLIVAQISSTWADYAEIIVKAIVGFASLAGLIISTSLTMSWTFYLSKIKFNQKELNHTFTNLSFIKVSFIRTGHTKIIVNSIISLTSLAGFIIGTSFTMRRTIYRKKSLILNS